MIYILVIQTLVAISMVIITYSLEVSVMDRDDALMQIWGMV